MLRYAQITDAPLYLGDNELVGMVDEFSVPELESDTIEHDTLGAIGVLKLPSRGLNALEGSITLTHPEPEFLAMTANPNKARMFQLHSKLDVFNEDGFDEAKSTTLVTIVRANFTKQAFPAGKKKEGGKFTADFTVTRLVQRLFSEQTPLVEIDLFARIYKVNGANVWPN